MTRHRKRTVTRLTFLVLGGLAVLIVVGIYATTRDANPLANTAWHLVAMGPADAPAAVIDQVTAEFTDTHLTGSTGCNAYQAAYNTRQSELHLDNLTWQEAGCPTRALFDQEQRIQKALATIEHFEIASDRLTLHSADDHVLILEPR